jgi:hypothetical protein
MLEVKKKARGCLFMYEFLPAATRRGSIPEIQLSMQFDE